MQSWRSEKYPECFSWVDSYKMPPRRCVVQDCDRVSNKELGILIHESPRTFKERVKWKRFVLHTGKTLIRKDRLVYARYTLRAIALHVQSISREQRDV